MRTIKAQNNVNDNDTKTVKALLAIDNTNASLSNTPGSSVVLIANPSLQISQSPNHKRAKLENSISGVDSDKVIADIVEELVDTSAFQENEESQEENSYQCGVCAKVFVTEGETTKHIEDKHGKSECAGCIKTESQNKELMNEFEKIREDLRILTEKNENLIKKNESMNKEIKIMKVALQESVIEKDNAKKELAESQETVMKTIRENTVLNDELKLKNSLIQEITEGKDDLSNENINETNVEDIIEEISVKCGKCDFEALDTKTLTSHISDVHENRYNCKQCTRKFNSQNSLNDHIKAKHTPVDKEFQCDKCSSVFKSQKDLTKHSEDVHLFHRFSCITCGFIKLSKESIEEHNRTAHTNFESTRQKKCRYFLRGYCIKGANCKYVHPTQSVIRRPMERGYGNVGINCRNGRDCHYLMMGICKFNHSLVDNTQGRFPNNSNWCYYGVECEKIPICPFKHPQQVFPQVYPLNHPPIVASSRRMRGF